MSAIHDVLVPLDGSPAAERSLPHASAVALSTGARLHLVRVVGSSSGMPTADPVQWRLDRGEARVYLEEIAGALEEDGAKVESSVLAGRPDEEIVRYARSEGVDVVILTPTGEGRCGEGPMGGTAHKIVDRIGTSVLLVRPEERGLRGEYSTVMVPVDGSPASEWGLRSAADLLPDSGGRLVVVHIVETPVAGSHKAEEEERIGRSMLAARRRRAEEFLERACNQIERPGLRVETRVLPGSHVTRRLRQLADQEEADLVVLSAHGESGTAPWPYGSVATRMLHYGRQPTLVLQDQPAAAHARPAVSRDVSRRALSAISNKRKHTAPERPSTLSV